MDYVQQLNAFYNAQYAKYGSDSRSTGYSPEGQRVRYDMLASITDLNGKSVLDVGCGLGNFLEYMNEQGIKVDFTGYEINSNFICECRQKFPGVAFELRDIIQDPPEPGGFDVVFFNGGLNTKIDDNEGVMRKLLKVMVEACRELCAITLTSTYAGDSHRHDFNHYFDPCQSFTFAKSLTNKVDLLHSYLPHDFTLVLYK